MKFDGIENKKFNIDHFYAESQWLMFHIIQLTMRKQYFLLKP